jgi:hypothetical protein
MAAGPVNDVGEFQRLPQFRLRTLFLLMGFLAVLFAIMGFIGPMASAALLFFLALVGLHVAGNALGTSLRDRVSDQVGWQHLPSIGRPLFANRPAWTALAPRLSEHTPIGWIIWAIGLLGALTGGALGRMAFGQLDSSPSELAVGTISLAVLGAFLGFLIGSFLTMLLRAWNQASRDFVANDIATAAISKKLIRRPLLPMLCEDVSPALVAEIDAG